MKHLLFFGIAFAAFYISHSQRKEFCNLPADEGTGPKFEFEVYYDVKQDMCLPFLYKGEGGNQNRFENEKECIRNCSLTPDKTYPVEAFDICRLPKSSGSSICSANSVRYFYDAIHDKCKKFIYSGCIGNGNRFPEQSVCNATCAGIHVDGDEPEEDETDTPIAIICGVLLAVIVVAIFTTVIVLTLKSKKKHAKKDAGKPRDVQSASPLQESAIEME
ncbi:BPTI/Kunitz domain-containing protein [Scomber japonicus]|uniref:BPTI/Kunitz domain-containing protein n=1 Tax=Scomber japonicus TaxID=13676 RepID=UPI002304F96A|nr:BPTI/Kunitz domain-containing protein [Scomber japonicus]